MRESSSPALPALRTARRGKSHSTYAQTSKPKTLPKPDRSSQMMQMWPFCTPHISSYSYDQKLGRKHQTLGVYHIQHCVCSTESNIHLYVCIKMLLYWKPDWISRLEVQLMGKWRMPGCGEVWEFHTVWFHTLSWDREAGKWLQLGAKHQLPFKHPHILLERVQKDRNNLGWK